MSDVKMDPAAIARRLSPAQRESLMRKPCQSWYSGPPACMPPHMSSAMALWRRGLIYGYGSTPTRNAYALSPLGLAVRAALLAMEGGDHG